MNRIVFLTSLEAVAEAVFPNFEPNVDAPTVKEITRDSATSLKIENYEDSSYYLIYLPYDSWNKNNPRHFSQIVNIFKAIEPDHVIAVGEAGCLFYDDSIESDTTENEKPRESNLPLQLSVFAMTLGKNIDIRPTKPASFTSYFESSRNKILSGFPIRKAEDFDTNEQYIKFNDMRKGNKLSKWDETEETIKNILSKAKQNKNYFSKISSPTALYALPSEIDPGRVFKDAHAYLKENFTIPKECSRTSNVAIPDGWSYFKGFERLELYSPKADKKQNTLKTDKLEDPMGFVNEAFGKETGNILAYRLGNWNTDSFKSEKEQLKFYEYLIAKFPNFLTIYDRCASKIEEGRKNKISETLSELNKWYSYGQNTSLLYDLTTDTKMNKPFKFTFTQMSIVTLLANGWRILPSKELYDNIMTKRIKEAAELTNTFLQNKKSKVPQAA